MWMINNGNVILMLMMAMFDSVSFIVGVLVLARL